ncbi:MAG: hypothetical protein NTZ02_01940 [Candidatus Woesearchaeota archaeon]|nr:hypothetical protein [Candidatus Woesearchaeota archaeon]
MGKKGQLSIFIIIAIVILFSFMLIIIFSKSIGEEKIHTQILSMAEKKGAIASINSNIDSCLKFAADSAIELAGKQGGFIFALENGPRGLADPAKVVRNEKGVYWILRDASDNPPGYPKYPNLVGIPQIPVLTSNELGIFGSKYPTIKEQIERFSEYQFGQCLNFSLFEGQEIEIKPNPPKISVAFGESNTIFYLDYPIKIIMGNETQQETNKKSYSSGIRFLKLYQIAKNLAYNDLNPQFFFIPSIINQQKYNPLMAEVGITVNPGPDYDIITLTDTKIKPNYYILKFLRQNRNPILSYIPDITVNISDNINITATAIDPDEDNVVISANYTKIDVFSPGVHTPMGDAVKNNHMKFTTGPSDIGYYSYNITATDDGNLKDWQEVTVKIMCQYRSHAIRDGSSWKDDSGKMFAYNPECCDQTSVMPYLQFIAGRITSTGCTCDENGQCEGQCIPNCPSSDTIDCGTTYTSSNGCGGNCNIIGTKCADGEFCSNGKCCYEIENCKLMPTPDNPYNEVCTYETHCHNP